MSGIAASLGPLRVLKGARTPGQPDVRTPGHTDSQAPAQPDVHAAGQTEARTSARADIRTAGRTRTGTAGRADAREPGKRSDGAYRKRTVLLRDTTWRKASRKWQDEGNGDFSDLVEELLLKYVEGK